jgi:ABC-2 type transport system permease protein
MSACTAVFKREIKGYFTTPIAYVFLFIFLFIAGYWPFHNKFFELRQADLHLFFNSMPLLLGAMASCIAMRLWAEEKKSGSIELLFSMPVTVPQAVLGKFFAAWLFLSIALLLTITMPLTVIYLSRPGWPDIGVILAGYLGTLLMVGTFLAVGCFFSALTKNQIISAILTFAAILLLYYLSMPSTLNYISSFLPKALLPMIESMSLLDHYESIQKGLVRLSDILYFALLIFGWIAACMVVLDERKAA